jgi:hypothetical protein
LSDIIVAQVFVRGFVQGFEKRITLLGVIGCLVIAITKTSLARSVLPLSGISPGAWPIKHPNIL